MDRASRPHHGVAVHHWGNRTTTNQQTQEQGQVMEATQEQQLDTALARIQSVMVEWGLDEWLGHRTPETMRLSVNGATNLLDLVNTLTGEINRLEQIIEYDSHN
jgi:hypothetical protein